VVFLFAVAVYDVAQMKAVFITINTLALFASVLSFAGSICDCGNVAELFASARLPLIYLLVLSSLMAGALKAKRTVICLGVLTLLSVGSLAQFFIKRTASPETGSNKIRILEMNLWGGRNRSKNAIIEEIKRQDPDVICLSEITGSLLATLKSELPSYSFALAEPTHGGVALFSRIPVRDASVKFCAEAKRSRIVVCVAKKNVVMRVFSVHTQVPIRTQELRDKELQDLASEIQNSKEPVLLVGDLNLTPFSYHFNRLLQDANLIDSEKGFGIQPTWNAFIPITLIPIDHCLSSASFVTTNRQLGHHIGSDHLPLVVDLSYPDK
jgi:endonuclease/exonuclease/phosphatase (EEP) superfamily protein YafD